MLSESICALVLAVIIGMGISFAQTPVNANTNQQECLQAAKAALGPEASVLHCGDLNSDEALEAVVAVRRRLPRTGCTPVSHVLILRRTGRNWEQAFEAAPQFTKNAQGYVGMDYIDDSDPPFNVGYCVHVEDRKPFGMSLAFIDFNGRVDEGALPLYIAWNAGVRRFQEVTSNEGDPIAFAPERKDLPHVNLRQRPSRSQGKKR